jgi:ethanolamine utilization protein EutP (predicted NTPase)
MAPVEGSAEEIAAHLRALAQAGADEAILVVSPIDERSIRTLGDALAALDP